MFVHKCLGNKTNSYYTGSYAKDGTIGISYCTVCLGARRGRGRDGSKDKGRCSFLFAAGGTAAGAGFVIEVVGAFAVGVLMLGVAVVVMVFAGFAVIMPAFTVGIAGVGKSNARKPAAEEHEGKDAAEHEQHFFRVL